MTGMADLDGVSWGFTRGIAVALGRASNTRCSGCGSGGSLLLVVLIV